MRTPTPSEAPPARTRPQPSRVILPFPLDFTFGPVPCWGHCPPGCGPKTGRALIAEMKGQAVACTRSKQMSTAFIRKTPNYPLLPTLFHLLPGQRRLLVRKAALSAIALAGGMESGVRVPTSPSESPRGLAPRGGWAIRNTGSTLPFVAGR